jgi:hypothetical protein
MWKAGKQRFYRDPCLQARERSPKAIMNAEAKTKMILGITRNIKHVGTRELTLIAIS